MKVPPGALPKRNCGSAAPGQTFNLYKRHINASEPWTLAASYDRPDLPETLQVGLNIYTDSQPDLQIRFENIKIESIASPAECETN